MNKVSALKLELHDHIVGYLIAHQGGANELHFSPEFLNNATRPTLGILTSAQFPNSKALLEKPWSRKHRLHPILSNLLPEGSLREIVAQGLKVHIDNEFQILAYLGHDLPGALIATPITATQLPAFLLKQLDVGQAEWFDNEVSASQQKFSLAGVQMKFSMTRKDGRYNLANSGELGDWIVKTPSTKFHHVPENEFTAMSLAATAGINIPEMKLVELSNIGNLPQTNLPDEPFAFAIKRFDRKIDAERSILKRIHIEDFAQVFAKYPHEKYNSANYEQIARVLFEYSGDAIADVQQFAKRLLVNILLANGDAHLKNWSLIYQDQTTPRLSPAYDIVHTASYIQNEVELAMNMAKTKKWHELSLAHFEYWAKRAGLPWRAIKPHLLEVLAIAKTKWAADLEHLPMHVDHKHSLKQHWQKLHKDFRF